MIRMAPVTIQPCSPAGQAVYVQQMVVYTQAHDAGKPSEDRPYPLTLTPGTVAVGSGECHQCGQLSHFFDKCTATAEMRIPEMEIRWRQIIQSIIGRIVCVARKATAINVVTDTVEEFGGNVFGVYSSTEYNQLVSEDYLAQQGKG
jgi:hypothetical protein